MFVGVLSGSDEGFGIGLRVGLRVGLRDGSFSVPVDSVVGDEEGLAGTFPIPVDSVGDEEGFVVGLGVVGLREGLRVGFGSEDNALVI